MNTNNALAGALTSLNSTPQATVAKVGAGQRVSSLVYDSKSKQLTMVVSGVELNYERGERMDKATNMMVPNSSIKLMALGRGNYGMNLFGVKIDGTPVRCNMAFRLNLSNEQHAKDSDQIIA